MVISPVVSTSVRVRVHVGIGKVRGSVSDRERSASFPITNTTSYLTYITKIMSY